MKKTGFFRNILKTTETILIKKIERNNWRFDLQKALMSEIKKNEILRDINSFGKMSVSALPNFVYTLSQKLV